MIDAPDTLAVRHAVAAALADLPRGSLVLVACSGGPDSLALAAATAWAARRSRKRALRDGGAVLGLRAGAIVVDHNLQEGSARVAERAAADCRAFGLDPVTVESVAVPGGGAGRGHGGPEAAARTARRGALHQTARRLGAHAVLLGHTLDDQAETVLLALGRGAGPRALAGMAPTQEDPYAEPPGEGTAESAADVAPCGAESPLIMRPLLGVRRSDTVGSCEELGLDPYLDPTNAADGPWRAADGSALRRAAIREQALPALAEALGQDAAPALARTAARIRQDAEVLDALAEELLESARRGDGATGPGTGVPDTTLVLDIGMLRAAPLAVRSRALHAALLRAGAHGGALTHRHVEAVDHLLRVRGRGASDLPGVRAHRDDSLLILTAVGAG